MRRATGMQDFTLDVIPKTWEQEIEADIYGIRFLIPPSKMTISTRADLDHLSWVLAERTCSSGSITYSLI